MKLDCFKVKVKTCNSSNNSTRSTWMVDKEYIDCENGIAYVTTNDPKKIYDLFEDIISIEKIGVAYHIQEEDKESAIF